MCCHGAIRSQVDYLTAPRFSGTRRVYDSNEKRNGRNRPSGEATDRCTGAQATERVDEIRTAS